MFCNGLCFLGAKVGINPCAATRHGMDAMHDIALATGETKTVCL